MVNMSWVARNGKHSYLGILPYEPCNRGDQWPELRGGGWSCHHFSNPQMPPHAHLMVMDSLDI